MFLKAFVPVVFLATTLVACGKAPEASEVTSEEFGVYRQIDVPIASHIDIRNTSPGNWLLNYSHEILSEADIADLRAENPNQMIRFEVTAWLDLVAKKSYPVNPSYRYIESVVGIGWYNMSDFTSEHSGQPRFEQFGATDGNTHTVVRSKKLSWDPGSISGPMMVHGTASAESIRFNRLLINILKPF